jgi:hypothetical protein
VRRLWIRRAPYFSFIEIAGIQKSHLVDALNNEVFDDMEDCLQTECARSVNADYVITRNIKDFSVSSIPAILPEDFLKILLVFFLFQSDFFR